jgi:VCBS repeat-containing protein
LGTNEDTPLSMSTSSLIANDSGATSITAVSALAVDSTGVAYGSMTMANGNVVFTPNATADSLKQGDIKEVYFTYTNNTGAVRSVKVNITGVDNDASGISGAGYRYDLSAPGNQTLTMTVEDIVKADGQGMGGFNQFNTGNGWTAGTYALGATENRYQVVVDGNAGDAVSLQGVSGLSGAWAYAGTVLNGAVSYAVYNHSAGTGQVLVRAGVTLSDAQAPALDLNAAVVSSNNAAAFVSAVNFDGVNDYVRLPSVTLASQFTLQAWVNADNLAQSGPIRYFDFGLGTGTTNSIVLRKHTSSNTLVVYINSGGTDLANFAVAGQLTQNEWTHVALTVNGTSARVYLNGVDVGGGTLTAALPSRTYTGATLGANNNLSGDFFDGQMRDVRVYNDARTAAEISADLVQPANTADANLRLAYAFDGSAMSALSTQAHATLGNGANIVRAYDMPLSLDNAAAPATLSEISAITAVTVTASGLRDGVNEKLLVGNSAISANGAVTSGTVVVDGTSWNWSYGSGSFTFTSGDATTSSKAQELIRAFSYQNQLDTATEGQRSFVVGVTDAAGNTGSQTVVFTPLAITSAGTAYTTSVNQATVITGKATASTAVELNINGTLRTVNSNAQGDWTYTLKQVPLVRYVMVRLDPPADPYNSEGIFHLAEVQVFRNGTNVAAGRTATLSWGGTSTNVTDGATGWGVEKTGAGEHWVQIDLGALYAANSIKVFQQAGWPNRLNGADLMTSAFDMSSFTRAQLVANSAVNKSMVALSGGSYTYVHPNVGNADTLLAGNNTITVSTTVGDATISKGTHLFFNTNGASLAPVVVDMDGDGALGFSRLVADVDADGLADHSDWVGSGDGVLFHDKYGDGQWTDWDQIAFVGYGGNTDLEGLAAGFDTNGDGLFDAQDAAFDQFALWRDLNQNARVDAYELSSLVSFGVQAIVLNTQGQAELVGNSVVYGQTQVLLNNGASLAAWDVSLAYTSGADLAEADRIRAYTVV